MEDTLQKGEGHQAPAREPTQGGGEEGRGFSFMQRFLLLLLQI
jgi:hypothetical protein